MLKIGDKTFLNLQEAVAWLMENNCIPFQCTAPYAANTEIGMGTIVNPSPAKVRIGSIIFFSDSKVSTVTGITQNGFMVSDKYNDLVDDVVYVSNVALNGSGHLIVTLSNDEQIDAGLIKQVSSFSINASQHLIANYNDGTSTDLGAIFNGNVNIAGNFTADSIIENMSGYSFIKRSEDLDWTPVYVGVVKNGNKLTFCIFGKLTYNGASLGNIGHINVPVDVANKLYPITVAGIATVLENKGLDFLDTATLGGLTRCSVLVQKFGQTVSFQIRSLTALTASHEYLFRIEQTFLLSDSLAS